VFTLITVNKYHLLKELYKFLYILKTIYKFLIEYNGNRKV